MKDKYIKYKKKYLQKKYILMGGSTWSYPALRLIYPSLANTLSEKTDKLLSSKVIHNITNYIFTDQLYKEFLDIDKEYLFLLTSKDKEEIKEIYKQDDKKKIETLKQKLKEKIKEYENLGDKILFFKKLQNNKIDLIVQISNDNDININIEDKISLYDEIKSLLTLEEKENFKLLELICNLDKFITDQDLLKQIITDIESLNLEEIDNISISSKFNDYLLDDSEKTNLENKNKELNKDNEADKDEDKSNKIKLISLTLKLSDKNKELNQKINKYIYIINDNDDIKKKLLEYTKTYKFSFTNLIQDITNEDILFLLYFILIKTKIHNKKEKGYYEQILDFIPDRFTGKIQSDEYYYELYKEFNDIIKDNADIRKIEFIKKININIKYIEKIKNREDYTQTLLLELLTKYNFDENIESFLNNDILKAIIDNIENKDLDIYFDQAINDKHNIDLKIFKLKQDYIKYKLYSTNYDNIIKIINKLYDTKYYNDDILLFINYNILYFILKDKLIQFIVTILKDIEEEEFVLFINIINKTIKKMKNNELNLDEIKIKVILDEEFTKTYESVSEKTAKQFIINHYDNIEKSKDTLDLVNIFIDDICNILRNNFTLIKNIFILIYDFFDIDSHDKMKRIDDFKNYFNNKTDLLQDFVEENTIVNNITNILIIFSIYIIDNEYNKELFEKYITEQKSNLNLNFINIIRNINSNFDISTFFSIIKEIFAKLDINKGNYIDIIKNFPFNSISKIGISIIPNSTSYIGSCLCKVTKCNVTTNSNIEWLNLLNLLIKLAIQHKDDVEIATYSLYFKKFIGEFTTKFIGEFTTKITTDLAHKFLPEKVKSIISWFSNKSGGGNGVVLGYFFNTYIKQAIDYTLNLIESIDYIDYTFIVCYVFKILEKYTNFNTVNHNKTFIYTYLLLQEDKQIEYEIIKSFTEFRDQVQEKINENKKKSIIQKTYNRLISNTNNDKYYNIIISILEKHIDSIQTDLLKFIIPLLNAENDSNIIVIIYKLKDFIIKIIQRIQCFYINYSNLDTSLQQLNNKIEYCNQKCEEYSFNSNEIELNKIKLVLDLLIKIIKDNIILFQILVKIISKSTFLKKNDNKYIIDINDIIQILYNIDNFNEYKDINEYKILLSINNIIRIIKDILNINEFLSIEISKYTYIGIDAVFQFINKQEKKNLLEHIKKLKIDIYNIKNYSDIDKNIISFNFKVLKLLFSNITNIPSILYKFIF